jgi:hypothetical protein
MGENKMKRIKTFIAVGAFSLLAVALPTVASAQWGGQTRGGIFNSRYGDIRGTVISLQSHARDLDRQVNRIDNRRDDRQDRYRGYDRYDRIDDLDRLTTQFKNAAEDLADEYGRGRNMNSSRDEARRVLGLASQIDQVIDRSRRGRNNNVAYLQNEWNQIETDLRVIARAYGLNYRNTSGLRSRLPF